MHWATLIVEFEFVINVTKVSNTKGGTQWNLKFLNGGCYAILLSTLTCSFSGYSFTVAVHRKYNLESCCSLTVVSCVSWEFIHVARRMKFLLLHLYYEVSCISWVTPWCNSPFFDKNVRRTQRNFLKNLTIE